MLFLAVYHLWRYSLHSADCKSAILNYWLYAKEINKYYGSV